ncbi:MAG TPA: hypothetical protein VNO30_26865 [Kofleriaceae bacterium]|nr:hypothetical protein [Kofleriaceae bacterium]
MTTEERTDRTRHEARLETLEREVRLIAAGEAANAQRITDTRVELEQQIGDRIQVRDIEIHRKLDALSAEHTQHKGQLDALSAEHTQHKALLEDLQRDVRVIAEGHLANAQSIKDTKAALEQQIQQVDHRLMVLDVKVHAQLKGLEARFDDKLDAKLGALESRIDGKLDALGKDLSRIVAHFGLDGAPPPTERL